MTGLLSHPPIPVSQFINHVARLKLNDAVQFAAEYESIDPGGGAPGPLAPPLQAPAGTAVQAASVGHVRSAAVAPPLSWEASLIDRNKSKNRYANVVAYDHSRVRLRTRGGGGGDNGGGGGVDDYINANFVDGFRRTNAYIATQVCTAY